MEGLRILNRYIAKLFVPPFIQVTSHNYHSKRSSSTVNRNPGWSRRSGVSTIHNLPMIVKYGVNSDGNWVRRDLIVITWNHNTVIRASNSEDCNTVHNEQKFHSMQMFKCTDIFKISTLFIVKARNHRAYVKLVPCPCLSQTCTPNYYYSCQKGVEGLYPRRVIVKCLKKLRCLT